MLKPDRLYYNYENLHIYHKVTQRRLHGYALTQFGFIF